MFHTKIRRSRLTPLLMASLLAGCAHYTPLPLVSTPPLAPSVAALEAAPASAALSAALSVDEVVALALANNPDLKATRLKRSLGKAQARQAGILPNPSLSGAFLPLLSGMGTVPAWNLGLSQSIKNIITYRAQHQSAIDSARQIDADVVWQEWQVAGQARQIATDLIMGARSRPSYAAAYDLLVERNAKLETALAAGTTTLVIVAPDRTALQAARTALNTLDQRQLSLMHQLNELLGLKPDVIVPLASQVDLPSFDPAAIRADLTTLPDRRPDLIALRMGYAAADEQVRVAILSQFPDLVLGGSVASDNAKVINGGPNATIGLPIFDRNQGNIAIARATREQLHADYSARLAAAIGTVGSMLTEMEQLSAQLAVARRDLPAARSAAARARQAFGQSNLDERGYVDLVSNSFTKEQEIMTLELALLDRQIAIQTLIGAGLPVAGLPVEAGAR